MQTNVHDDSSLNITPTNLTSNEHNLNPHDYTNKNYQEDLYRMKIAAKKQMKITQSISDPYFLQSNFRDQLNFEPNLPLSQSSRKVFSHI